jgi:hypothetical protein
MTIELYRHIEPTVGYPSSYYTNVGEEYRGFLIIREGEYMLYSIKTKENGNPPIKLRSRFTHKVKAMDCVDKFLEENTKATTQ